MLGRLAVASAALVLLCAADAPPAGFDAAVAFGARPDIEDLSMSPDGSRVAAIVATVGQGTALVVMDAREGAPTPKPALISEGDPERIQWCRWVSNRRLVCSIYGIVKDQTDLLPFTRLFAIDADGSNVKLLSKKENIYSQGLQLGGGEVIDWMPEQDGVVLMTRVQLADAHLGSRVGTDKSGLQVDRIDTNNVAASPVERPRDDAVDYISDGRGAVRLMGLRQRKSSNDMDSGVISYSYRMAGSRDWRPFGDYDYAHKIGFNPVAIDHDHNLVYGYKKKDGRTALYSVTLDGTNTETLVFARPDVDVSGLVRIGRNDRVVGISYVTDVRQVIYFDPDLARLAASFRKALPNQPLIRIVDASADESRLLIWAGSDDDPGLYYIFDRKTRRMEMFKPVRPHLEGMKLAKVKPISFPAADGTMIPAYLTLPPGKESATGLPAIVMPHGGPGYRDEWGFDWLSQYFAALGYAVLQPNFRGSSGYGDAWFVNNGFQSWKVAIGDVSDGGRWLVSQKIADPGKLAIVGWSYGGYSALQSAVVDPTLFKAVVAIAPVTDLASLKRESEGWSNRDLVRDFVGTGPHIKEGSPAQNAGRIKAPVLLFHAEMDRNVRIGESTLMNDRLGSAGVPHELVTWEKLDHQIEDSAARATMLRKSDEFIRKAIGM